MIVPKPQKIKLNTDFLDKQKINKIYLGIFESVIFKQEINAIFNNPVFIDTLDANLVFIQDNSLKKQEYNLLIEKEKITIHAASLEGAFYAAQTLKQIMKDDIVNCLEIHDYPLLEIRGVMLDISRSKVPNLDTLKKLVDLFAYLKINHLQLYVEGFSYEYQNFKKEIEINKNYITLKDYLELEKYCNERFIDLVPNQNGFGHMGDWLALDEYKELAECPDGFFIWGANRPPSTLDPTNEKSLEFVKKLYDDMLPHFKSKYFNMDFDEPFELGHGKSKEIVLEKGEGNVFIEFFNKLSNHVKSYQKIPMLWGDVLLKHPSDINKLPKDVIFIDWGYNHKYDFDSHAKLLSEQKLEFMVAPGTVTWGNILGNYLDMTGSIKNACDAAKKYHAKGVLVTDWGDIGHLQYLPVSIPGFTYTSMLSWNDASTDDLEEAVMMLFGNKTLGKLIIDLSKFIPLEGEYRDYGCRLFYTILWAEHASRYENKVEFFKEKMKYNLIDSINVKKLSDFFESALTTLEGMENTLIVEELKNSIFLLQILLDINVKLTIIYKNEDEIDFQKEISLLEIYSEKHLKLWDARNIHEGYKMSNQRILWLKNLLALMENGKEIK